MRCLSHGHRSWGQQKNKKKSHCTNSEREGNQGITGPLFNPVLQDVTSTTENMAQANKHNRR